MLKPQINATTLRGEGYVENALLFMLIILQDSVGEVLCYCPNGYTLDSNKTCQDIDECAIGNNLCSAATSACINTAGRYP